MRILVALSLLLFSVVSHAGGISFKPTYVGVHPISGTTVTFTVDRDGVATLNVANTLGQAENLTLEPKTRNNFETIFNLKENGEVLAHLITTGDCQEVQAFVLVFPSGLNIPMHVPRKARARNNRESQGSDK